MNTTVFHKLKETFQPEKMSIDVSHKDFCSPLAKKEMEKQSEFAITLEKVSTQHKEKPTSVQAAHEQIQHIREKIASLSENQENQTNEKITEILEAILSFFQQGINFFSSDTKKEATEILSSFQEMVSAWEKGKLTNQEFLQNLLGWLDKVQISLLGSFSEKREQPFIVPKPEETLADENHSVSQDKEFSSKMFQENQKGVQEKPVVRVVDKRSHSLITEKSLAEGTTIKESFSSKIEHFLKQIEPKDGMVPSFAKPIQDFGLKIAPALPSLPRVSVEQMLQQVVGKAFITLRDGQSEMRLQLTPPDLGRMEMKIILEDGQMMGKIVVSTPEAKALFDQNLGELQRQLQQAGVQVGGLDVSLGQPGSDKNPESVGDFSRLSTQGKGDVITSEEGSSLSLWADARVNYLV